MRTVSMIVCFPLTMFSCEGKGWKLVLLDLLTEGLPASILRERGTSGCTAEWLQ